MARWSVAGMVLCCFIGGIQAQDSDFSRSLGDPEVPDYFSQNVCGIAHCADDITRNQLFDWSGLTPSYPQIFNVTVSNGTLTTRGVTLSAGPNLSSLDTPTAVSDFVANGVSVVVEASALPKKVAAFLGAFPEATGNISLGLSLIEYLHAYNGEATKAEDAQIGLSTNVVFVGLGLFFDAPIAALVFSETGLFLQAPGSPESQSSNFYVAPDPVLLHPPVPPMPDAGSQVVGHAAPLSAPFTFANSTNSMIVDPSGSQDNYSRFGTGGSDTHVNQAESGFGALVPYLQFAQLGSALSSLTASHQISQPSYQSMQQPLWWSGVNLSRSPTVSFNPYFDQSVTVAPRSSPAQPIGRTAQGTANGIDWSCPSWFSAWARAYTGCGKPWFGLSPPPTSSATAGATDGGAAISGAAKFTRSSASGGASSSAPEISSSRARVDEHMVFEGNKQTVPAPGTGVAVFNRKVMGAGVAGKVSLSAESQDRPAGVAVFSRTPPGAGNSGATDQSSGVAVFARDPNRMGTPESPAGPFGGVAGNRQNFSPNTYASRPAGIATANSAPANPRSLKVPTSRPIAKPVTVTPPRPAIIYHK